MLLARRRGKPVVLTLYGTEIWHYEPKRCGPDLFTRAYRRAAHVTFYSDGLLTRAHRARARPAATRASSIRRSRAEFTFHDEAAQAGARAALGHQRAVTCCVNVKRLHPLAGQRYLHRGA